MRAVLPAGSWRNKKPLQTDLACRGNAAGGNIQAPQPHGMNIRCSGGRLQARFGGWSSAGHFLIPGDGLRLRKRRLPCTFRDLP